MSTHPLQTIIARLEHIPVEVEALAPELMQGLLGDIVEDNRIKVLSGVDKNGVPMVPVKYRNAPARPARGARGGALYGVRTLGHYLGPELKDAGGNVVARAAASNGNLTTKEYKKLTGPPLAPRGSRSRVIANLAKLEPSHQGDTWVARAGWLNVLSKKGVPFLRSHFEGKNRLPVRDLSGVTPQGMERARVRVRDWIRDLLGSI